MKLRNLLKRKTNTSIEISTFYNLLIVLHYCYTCVFYCGKNCVQTSILSKHLSVREDLRRFIRYFLSLRLRMKKWGQTEGKEKMEGKIRSHGSG